MPKGKEKQADYEKTTFKKNPKGNKVLILKFSHLCHNILEMVKIEYLLAKADTLSCNYRL